MAWEGEPPCGPFVTNGSAGASPSLLNSGIHRTAIAHIQTSAIVLRQFKERAAEVSTVWVFVCYGAANDSIQ